MCLPVSIRLRLLQPPQVRHSVNSDQGLRLQSSRQGTRQGWNRHGMGPAHCRQSATSAAWPSSRMHVTPDGTAEPIRPLAGIRHGEQLAVEVTKTLIILRRHRQHFHTRIKFKNRCQFHHLIIMQSKNKIYAFSTLACWMLVGLFHPPWCEFQCFMQVN